MAELRDRYKSHGFDEQGNDKNIKIFEKATKQLLEFSRDLPKEYKKQLEATKKEYSENFEEVKNAISDMGKTVSSFGKVVGQSAKGSLANAAATATQAVIGGAGPMGYVLEKTLNLSGGVKALVDSFEMSKKKRPASDLSTEDVGLGSVAKAKDKKISKDTFESYPTIVKLRSWLNFQTKDNPLFKKYMLSMQQRAKEQSKFEKDQKKEQFDLKKIFQKLKENSDKESLKTTLIAAGVVAGVAALTSLGFYLKGLLGQRFGSTENTNLAPTISTIAKKFQSGDYAANLRVSSPYGKRTMKNPKTGVTETKLHHGVDIAGELGAPVESITPGKAYARMETTNGFQNYRKASSRDDMVQFDGYGIFVDVICYPATATRLGFPGRQVTVRYAHLSGVAFSGQGVPVVAGQLIGFMGDTGRSDGVHTHLEVLVDGNKVPANSIGKQYGFKNGKAELQYTVNPETLKFLDKEGRETTAVGAFYSFASEGVDEYNKRVKSITPKGKKAPVVNTVTHFTGVGNQAVNIFRQKGAELGIPGVTAPQTGVPTGPAASITSIGKNDTLMGTNNITYSKYSVPSSNNQAGYVGTLPTLAPTVSGGARQPEFQLNFDIENSATKALKKSDKSIDFIKQ